MKKNATPFLFLFVCLLTMNLNAIAQYCGGPTGSGLYNNSCNAGYITNVSILNTTLNNTTTCTGVSFATFNTAQATASIQQGGTYTFSVTTNTSSIIAAWIDYNQNNTFEASEFTQVAVASDTLVPALMSFTVPINAVVGQTGMRIRSRTSGNPNGAGDACTTGYFSGEGEHYTITITAAPPCNPNVNAGIAVSNDDTVCYFNNFTLSLQSADIAAGISYVWQSSPDNVNWTPIQFANSSTLTTSQYVATYYRCVLSCNGGTPTFSTPVKVYMSEPTYYNFGAGTIFTEDFENWVDGCDNHDLPSEYWTSDPSSGNISWRRQDEGYTRGGWTFNSAMIPPHQGTGCAAFHTPASPNLNVYDGSMYLHLNCSNFSTIDLTFWYYKVCCLAGFDSVSVYFSTNGGFTYSPALAHFTNDTLYPNPSVWKNRGVANIPVNNSAFVVLRIRDSGDLAGSDDTGIDDLKVDGVLGRADLTNDLSNIAFLPNPSKGNVELRCSNPDFLKSHLFILDNTGRVVVDQNFANASQYWSQNLDLSALPKGMYHVKMISENKVFTQKLILE